jgi:hypothetical protein
MPRKIIVQLQDGGAPVLQEIKAEDEFQLQELVKDNPDLLPIEEFGMTGPLMVIGRETTLPSGAVDLVALARSGELLIIEFKTGPQNTDFRSALTQLIDYGSDMWTMSYDDFESTVPLRYFGSERCKDDRLRGSRSLEEAVRAFWGDDISDEDLGALRDRLCRQLESGAFHYVLVAQRFTNTIERTVDYLNSAMSAARAYAVELVRFQGDSMAAFESRTVLKPTRATRPGAPSPTYIDEGKLFDAIGDEEYRTTLREFLETCRGLGFRFEWGAAGVSVRAPTPDRPEPLTIAWLFPPGRSGWMGLTDLNLGWDRWSANHNPSIQPVLDEYLQSVQGLPGAESAKARNLKGTVYHLSPESAIRSFNSVREILASLASGIGAKG